jgi:hypothetical protein
MRFSMRCRTPSCSREGKKSNDGLCDTCLKEALAAIARDIGRRKIVRYKKIRRQGFL